MAYFLWSAAIILALLLLAYTTYAAFIGTAGAFARARWEQCPRCHHHYLTEADTHTVHHCPDGLNERIYQLVWTHTHHSTGAHR